MAVFDPKQVTVLLGGVEISDWADGGDVIDVKHNVDAGTMTIGADGRGVFVANPDESVTVTLKIKQHSADNKFLTDKKTLQRSNIGSFVPFSLHIKDLINGDLVTAQKGYFTTLTGFTRGTAHNASVWVIAFEKGNIKLEKGHGN